MEISESYSYESNTKESPDLEKVARDHGFLQHYKPNSNRNMEDYVFILNRDIKKLIKSGFIKKGFYKGWIKTCKRQMNKTVKVHVKIKSEQLNKNRNY
jgi:hypothetical protein